MQKNHKHTHTLQKELHSQKYKKKSTRRKKTKKKQNKRRNVEAQSKPDTETKKIKTSVVKVLQRERETGENM